jgi:hypothetical protein
MSAAGKKSAKRAPAEAPKPAPAVHDPNSLRIREQYPAVFGEHRHEVTIGELLLAANDADQGHGDDFAAQALESIAEDLETLGFAAHTMDDMEHAIIRLKNRAFAMAEIAWRMKRAAGGAQ